ncbi:MAG: hypothetical protein KAR06_02055, partial [Deltaproteobacteria bacterium]|nr:hypothetical protein [Deltaproteobacteria bacterium]
FFAVKYTAIQSHSAAIDGSIANSYSEIFPGEKIIDPFYQMEGKVKALGDLDLIKSGSVNVLKVLKELSLIKSSNRSDATLFKVGIKGLSVSAKGRAASFESAKAFKSLLESRASVSDVKMTDVKATTANDVIFSVKFSMLEEKL